MRLTVATRVAYALGTGAIASSAWAQASQSNPPAQRATDTTVAVERVLGIGGFFFRATDPQKLAEWYAIHLGVTRTPTSYGQEPWRQETGPTVFGPFSSNTTYFGRDTQQWMINFRVRSLDAMAAQLTRAGIAVDVDPQTYPNGRFARLRDPEGNPIQLWEAKEPSAGRTPVR